LLADEVSSDESPEGQELIQPVDDSSDEFDIAKLIDLQNKFAEYWRETDTMEADDTYLLLEPDAVFDEVDLNLIDMQ
jgi:hypothetical protein